jgi:peptidoglycan-associated lipoprotein
MLKSPTFYLRASALVLVTLLAACASSVKLDEIPVSDAKGVQVTPTTSSSAVSTPTASSPTAVVERGVQGVSVGAAASDAAGPAGVARVVLFDYDSFVIKPEFQSVIDAHARFLNANKSRKIAIEGHTDERGGREYNLALGQKRAEAVRRALGLLGVGDEQMEAVSFGEEKPADSASTEAAYEKNRRAELTYR